jgi:hypothetical protein
MCEVSAGGHLGGLKDRGADTSASGHGRNVDHTQQRTTRQQGNQPAAGVHRA